MARGERARGSARPAPVDRVHPHTHNPGNRMRKHHAHAPGSRRCGVRLGSMAGSGGSSTPSPGSTSSRTSSTSCLVGSESPWAPHGLLRRCRAALLVFRPGTKLPPMRQTTRASPQRDAIGEPFPPGSGQPRSRSPLARRSTPCNASTLSIPCLKNHSKSIADRSSVTWTGSPPSSCPLGPPSACTRRRGLGLAQAGKPSDRAPCSSTRRAAPHLGTSCSDSWALGYMLNRNEAATSSLPPAICSARWHSSRPKPSAISF